MIDMDYNNDNNNNNNNNNNQGFWDSSLSLPYSLSKKWNISKYLKEHQSCILTKFKGLYSLLKNNFDVL